MVSRGRAWIAAAALLVVHAALGISFALHASPTWDEVAMFGHGYHLLKTARWDFPGSHSNSPLSWYAQSLPLLVVGLREGNAWDYPEPPDEHRARLRWHGNHDPSRGQRLLYDNAQRFGEDRLMFYTRLPTLAISVFGGLVLFIWAGSLHGRAGGLLALALYALSPNMIAHGSLATTDLVMAVFALASAWALYRCWSKFTPARAAVAGLLLGLACLSKYTALVLLPLYALLLALGAWRRQGPLRGGAKPATRREALCRASLLLVTLLAVATITVVLGYRGHVGAFIDGVAYQKLNVEDGQTGYLMGEISRAGWWYFYPVVMAVKTPLGTLALALLGIALWIRREGLSMRLLFATLPFAGMLIFFIAQPLPVGVRYVLVVYPALMIAAGAVLAERRRWLVVIATVLLAWVTVSTARIHPHELSYFNEAAGGPNNGHHYLVDSNIDWGQDLKGLRNWMRERGLSSIQLGYLGTADPTYYGMRYVALPSFILRPLDRQRREWPPRGIVAVSVTCYHGLCYSGPPWNGNPYKFLHDLEPVDRIGYSILIFDVP